MSIMHGVPLQPFSVPSYVRAVMPPGRREDGLVQATTFHVSEIPEETLIALCDQFKADVLAKARKVQP